MPARLNAKGPGEFIRDHLQDPQTGGRDYVMGSSRTQSPKNWRMPNW